MPPPRFEPERLVAALNAADVAYVIVGGLAVAAHGVVRATAISTSYRNSPPRTSSGLPRR
jgi:hypothetical protein